MAGDEQEQRLAMKQEQRARIDLGWGRKKGERYIAREL
jgi:hypothetical protein